MLTNLPITSFIKPESIVEAAHAMPVQHNRPAIIDYQSGYTPEYWYNKLNLASLENKFNLPSKLLLHLIDIESKGDPNARSKKGAEGIFGVMPAHISGYTGNIKNPAETAIWVAGELRRLADRFGGYEKALAAYNWGRGHLARKGYKNIPKDTVKYVNHFKKKGVLGVYPKDSWGEEDVRPKDSWE